MSTKTLQPKRVPEERAIALMLIACRDQGLRWPEIVAFSAGGHLQLNPSTSGQVSGWAAAVGVECRTSVMPDGTVYFGASNSDWNGWNVNIGLFERPKPSTLDSETVELIGKATSDDEAGSPELEPGEAAAAIAGAVALGRVSLMDPGFSCAICPDPAAFHLLQVTHLGDEVVGIACTAHVDQVEAELLAAGAAA